MRTSTGRIARVVPGPGLLSLSLENPATGKVTGRVLSPDQARRVAEAAQAAEDGIVDLDRFLDDLLGEE